MLALVVLAVAPKWIDASIAGYALAYDEVHKPVGVCDERTGYMLVRSVECDGALLELLLTRDRKLVKEQGFIQPGKGLDPDGNQRLIAKSLPSLRTGKGIAIGDPPARVRDVLGRPKRTVYEGRFVSLVYEWRGNSRLEQTQTYTFKAGKLIEIDFCRDESEVRDTTGE